MTYFQTLPKELSELLYRYIYNDNLVIMNNVYKIFEKSYRCDDNNKLSPEDIEKRRTTFLDLTKLIKPFNIKYNIWQQVEKRYYGNILLTRLEIDRDTLLTDDLLFQIIKSDQFVNYIYGIMRTSHCGPGRSILIKLNKALKPSKIQFYVHYTDYKVYDISVYKT